MQTYYGQLVYLGLQAFIDKLNEISKTLRRIRLSIMLKT